MKKTVIFLAAALCAALFSCQNQKPLPQEPPQSPEEPPVSSAPSSETPETGYTGEADNNGLEGPEIYPTKILRAVTEYVPGVDTLLNVGMSEVTQTGETTVGGALCETVLITYRNGAKRLFSLSKTDENALFEYDFFKDEWRPLSTEKPYKLNEDIRAELENNDALAGFAYLGFNNYGDGTGSLYAMDRFPGLTVDETHTVGDGPRCYAVLPTDPTASVYVIRRKDGEESMLYHNDDGAPVHVVFDPESETVTVSVVGENGRTVSFMPDVSKDRITDEITGEAAVNFGLSEYLPFRMTTEGVREAVMKHVGYDGGNATVTAMEGKLYLDGRACLVAHYDEHYDDEVYTTQYAVSSDYAHVYRCVKTPDVFEEIFDPPLLSAVASSPSADGRMTVLFTTPYTLYDVKAEKVTVTDITEDGSLVFDRKPLEDVGTLNAAKPYDKPYTLDVTFAGDFPEYAITFTDPAGVTHTYGLSQSGFDGSPVLAPLA